MINRAQLLVNLSVAFVTYTQGGLYEIQASIR